MNQRKDGIYDEKLEEDMNLADEVIDQYKELKSELEP